MSEIKPKLPLKHPSLWRGEELLQRTDWQVQLSDLEIEELQSVAEGVMDQSVEGIELGDFELPQLTPRLKQISHDLEQGCGAAWLRGLPKDLDQALLERMFWLLALHLGVPLSQSAEGERLYSVADKGYAADDPRTRGPNTRSKLSYHTDRCDVIGFCCYRQAKSGGENRIVSSMAIYNEILNRRPDLLNLLCEPFYYLRHTVDGGNEKPWCQQPVFSFCDGHFAASLLRVLIDRAHSHPDLPDLSSAQKEALDLVENLADEPFLHHSFYQEPGDILFINNWVNLHRRTEFEDWPEPDRRRHIFRIWLSVPNSRPLDPLFLDNYGAVEAGALRGGMKPKALSTS